MITEDIRILKMVTEYPSTLEVLNKFSPLFKNQAKAEINNSIARRINVKQAAEIAGVDLTLLLNELNESINEESIPPKKNATKESKKMQNQKPEKLKKINAEKFLQLDVRPIIDSGKDPFLEIMSAVKSLKEDEVFHLINSFEPIPLYSVLEGRGFHHWTEKDGNTFNVFFFRDSEPSDLPENFTTKEKITEKDFDNVIELDVRELAPPEPMMKVLENISRIDENTLMVVHHHRDPVLLYPKLEERGYSAMTNKITDDYYKVVIMMKRKE